MTRRNPMVRVRRYDQRPTPSHGWFVETDDGGYFADCRNEQYERDRRMQSWRRPL
jgi:hypothetical protein